MSMWAKKLKGQEIVQYLSLKKVFNHFFAVINTSVKIFIKLIPGLTYAPVFGSFVI